jgi:hypothetical protein
MRKRNLQKGPSEKGTTSQKGKISKATIELAIALETTSELQTVDVQNDKIVSKRGQPHPQINQLCCYSA